MTLQNILENYRKQSFSTEDLGRRFERLMQAYLMTDPKYATIYNNVWLWNVGGHDVGIDLVSLM